MSQAENTTSAKKGAIESVLAFDGIDDYVQLPAVNTDYSQGFTVEAWVQYKSFRRSWSRIIDFGNGQGNKNIVLANVGTSSTLGLHLYCNNGTHTIEAPNTLEIDKWIHVAATIDKSGMAKLYKNGQLIQSKQISLPDNLNRTLNYIGKSNWANDGYFEGQIAEVRVWNIARPESELKENMSQRLKGNETGLVGYWPLNEGSENIAKDKTSNGNNGTINGATWGKSELPITSTKESEIGKKPDVITGGNLPTKYGIADTRTNFYLVDTNKPINGNGEITGWNIWAENTSPVQLIIYRNEANTWSVVGKSEVKTPVIGLNEFSLTTPIKVNQGDFVGIYYPQAGSISYDKNTAPLGNLSGKVLFTSSGATATAFSDSVDRIYSLSVKGNFGEIPIKIEKTETANYGVIGVGTNNLLCSRDTLTSDWKEIPNSGQIISIAVMPDGKIVGVGTNKSLYTRDTLTSDWKGVPNSAQVISIAIMPDGKIVGVGTNNILYTRDTLTSDWKQIPNSGAFVSVAVMPDGKIVGVGTNKSLYTRDSLISDWKEVPNSGAVISVTVMPDGKLVGVGANNRLYSRDSLTSEWKEIPNSGSVIAATCSVAPKFTTPEPVNSDYGVIGVGTNNLLCSRDTLTSEWKEIPNSGPVISVALVPDGRIVGVGTNNNLYTRDTLTSDWKQIPNSGAVIDVAVMPDDKIVGIGTNKNLYTQYNLISDWYGVPNSGLVSSVTVMPDGKLVGVGANNNRLYSRDSLTSDWKEVPNNGSVLDITVMPDGKIVGVGVDNRLYSRDTLTSDWKPIPNSGSVIAVTCSVPPKSTTPEPVTSDSVLAFDGRGNYIEVPYAEQLNPEQFTLSCWAKVEGSQGQWRSPVTSRTTTPIGGYKLYAGENNKWQFWTGDGSKWVVLTGSDVVLNTWTHVAATYDGSTMKLYINGELIGTPVASKLKLNTNRPLRIGAGKTEGNPGYFFNGQIAEVQLWNRVRSPEEIKQSMNQRLKGDETGLVGYWPLNEGSENIAKDKTSNGSNGTVNGATWRKSERPIPYGVIGVGTNNLLCGRDALTSNWKEIPNSGPVISVALMPDGKIVGVGTNNTLYTRDTLTSEWKQIPNSGPVIGVAVMPDGKIVGVGTNNTLYTRDTLTSEWKQIPNSGSVIGVTVMPDGKLVGIGMNNRLYSRDSLTSGWKYVSNNGSVLSITVMPDGKIVGVGGDNRLYIRDTLTSKWNPIPNSGSVIAVTCSVPPKATTPLEETKPIEQAKPTEETKPIEQTKPTEPIGPTGPTDQVSKPIKLGPTGGSISGTDFQILPKDTAPQSRLKKVFVNAGWAIDALQVEYENPASIPGETYLSDLVGGRGGTKEEFSTPVGDYLTKISGTWGMSAPGRPKQEIVTIQFETKKGVKSPVFGGKHGKQEVEPFVLEAPEGQEIIGFFGSYGGGQNLLVSLGIYCQTVTTLAKLEPSNPQTPSNNEAVTPKEQSSSIKPETLTPLEPSNPQTPSNNEAVTAEEQSSSIKPETLTPSEPSNPQTSESTQDKNMSETLSKPDTTEPTKPSNTTKKKRLVVCCDGTWNELATSYPTNVVKFARLVKYIANDQTPQIVHYISGCGTAEDADLIERLGGGAFGWGIDRIIQDAYRFLCMNYDVEAEDEIYLVGFSRGAYTVRCLAGMIYNCGLLSRSKIRELPKAYELYRNSKIKPNDPEAQKFREDNSKKIDSEKDYLQGRVPIKMLGCWDTVGALGVPDLTPWLPLAKLWNRKYEFFDARLSPIVENAFHAVAIDEKRRGFPSSGMERSDKNPEQVVKEVFFAGEHGCIGGGTEEYRGLSDFTLQWMIHEAKKLGLEFDSTENYREEFQIKPEPTTKFDNSVTGVYALAGEGWRPIESSKVAVHYSVVERLKADPNYRPRNLDSLLNNLLP